MLGQLCRTTVTYMSRHFQGFGAFMVSAASHRGPHIGHSPPAHTSKTHHSTRPEDRLGLYVAVQHPGRDKNYFTSNTPGRLWGWALRGWALQKDSEVGHSRETLGLGTPGTRLGLGTPRRLWDWAHCRENAGRWALQGDSGVGHSKNTLSWALQGHFGVGHSRDERGVDWARRRVPGEEKCSGRGEELSLKSNNPTPRVGNNLLTLGSTGVSATVQPHATLCRSRILTAGPVVVQMLEASRKLKQVACYVSRRQGERERNRFKEFGICVRLHTSRLLSTPQSVKAALCHELQWRSDA